MKSNENQGIQLDDSRSPDCRRPWNADARNESGGIERYGQPLVEVALLTGGGDKPYALGLASALIAQGIFLDFIGQKRDRIKIFTGEHHCFRYSRLHDLISAFGKVAGKQAHTTVNACSGS